MESLSRLTSRQLISKGVECVRADSLIDRAIACFSIVSNRYLENPEDTAVRRTATEALRHLGNIYSERILNSLDILLIKLYTETHQESKAIALIHPLLDNAVKNGLKDYEMSMYGKLTNIYDALGQQDSVEKYYSKYLVTRTEIEERNGMHHVAEMDFVSQIDKINSEVSELSLTRQKERRQHVIVVCILMVITILLLSLLWVYTNLKRNHRNLYIRNEEMNRREETHRLMREQLQNEIEQLKTRINSQTADSPKNEDTTENPETEEQLREDYARIVSWMEKSRDIYNPGFSLAKLSSAMSMPSQMVSKAINVCHGMNFHQFLNEYRIREVTRLMHDRNSDNLTVESLSESVGFKSRTTFASLFKKTTGLTPTEYWKMARQSKPGNQAF